MRACLLETRSLVICFDRFFSSYFQFTRKTLLSFFCKKYPAILYIFQALIYNTLGKFENWITVHTTPSRKRTARFSKTLFKPEERRDTSFAFKHLKNRLNNDLAIITWFSWPNFLKTNPKWPVIVGFSVYYGRSELNSWCFFGVKMPCSNFLRCNVNGTLD